MPRNLAEERKYSSNLELIHEAISCVKNAIEIYSHDLMLVVHSQNSNIYGLALSHF